MPTLDIDGLQFAFPADWKASKYDDWTFYRHHFCKQVPGIKAVDAIAFSPDRAAYLIEVKDYRHPATEKPSGLAEAVADKVLHTLAAMLPARLHALGDEKSLAKDVLRCANLQIVLHVELPPGHRHALVDLADIKQKLKILLRAVDTHPKIVSIQRPGNLAWNVT